MLHVSADGTEALAPVILANLVEVAEELGEGTLSRPANLAEGFSLTLPPASWAARTVHWAATVFRCVPQLFCFVLTSASFLPVVPLDTCVQKVRTVLNRQASPAAGCS
jgi:hypothetical protein